MLEVVCVEVLGHHMSSEKRLSQSGSMHSSDLQSDSDQMLARLVRIRRHCTLWDYGCLGGAQYNHSNDHLH